MSIPGTPEILIHGGTGGNPERDADMIYIHDVTVATESTPHIIQGHPVLYLVIQMKDAYLSFQIMFPDIVDAQVQQHAAVFPA